MKVSSKSSIPCLEDLDLGTAFQKPVQILMSAGSYQGTLNVTEDIGNSKVHSMANI